MNTLIPSQPENQLPDLIANLGDENGLVRQRARLMLVHIGQESIPALLEALKSKNMNTRWEAIKALGEFRDPRIAPALTGMLMDENIDIRWAAAESIINQGRDSLRPLLESFIKNFDSPWLRESLHHILHVLKDCELLKKEEIALFVKLDKQDIPGFESSWTGEAAWAAEKALEVLDREDW